MGLELPKMVMIFPKMSLARTSQDGNDTSQDGSTSRTSQDGNDTSQDGSGSFQSCLQQT